MPGRARAVANGDELARAVMNLGRELALEPMEQVRVARRIWGAERFIDVVLTHPQSRKTLGIECKFQGVRGTAEEKIPATIKDIEAWPIQGLVVFAGEGFTENMRSGTSRRLAGVFSCASSCSIAVRFIRPFSQTAAQTMAIIAVTAIGTTNTGFSRSLARRRLQVESSTGTICSRALSLRAQSFIAWVIRSCCSCAAVCP